jgi:signal transduction histidine kinase/predicted RNA-binding protein with RPS1 domain/CheY-like chemotaxis protein
MGNVPKPLKFNEVQVRVTEAHGSGLHVKILESGQTGFIPRREITWERRVSIPFALPQAGQKFEAVILNENKHNKITLSLRRICDPWDEVIAQKKYKYGQIVTGEVVNVRHFGAYVQLEPGIDAVIYPKEASFLSGENINGVLWIGDKIEAKIIDLDFDNHFIQLSITEAQQQKSSAFMSVDEHAKELLARFGAEAVMPLAGKITNMRSPRKSASVPEKYDRQHRIHKLSAILVVDDEPNWQDRIKTGLEKKIRASIDVASNIKDALGKFQQGTPYDLVLIDVNLGTEDGAELAQTLRETNPYLPILLISSAPLQAILNQYPSGLVNDEFLFAQKDTEINAIHQRIIEMHSGIAQTNQLSLSDENAWIRDLGLQAFSDQPISIVFDEILKWLHQETSISQCFLIRLDKVLREISISAFYPALSKEEIQNAQDGLYYSPATKILEESHILTENFINIKDDKYKNFFRGLDFKSCLGIPIQTPNQNTAAYALVLLDKNNNSFLADENLQKNKFTLAQFAAYFLSIAIERASVFDYMRRYEVQYSLGQLTNDLIHETSNKLNALDTTIKTIEPFWKQKPDVSNPQAIKIWFEKIDKPFERLSTINQELLELLNAYSQQARSEYSSLDINQIVLGVLRQLSRTADQNNVRLYAKPAKILSRAKGYQTSIKQVVLNLTLNAIQMFDLRQKWLLQVRKQTSRPVAIPEFGIVIVQTRIIEDDKNFPIEIRVIDSSPGIHWRDWERVFMQGISGRGGSGLGLYISRNLIERMGGKLILLDSILFVGSAFVIRLPAAPSEEI